MSQIITISGHAGSGKDTFAKRFVEVAKTKFDKSTMIIHYADILKYGLKTYAGWDGNKDEKGRQMLQYYGTDVGRNKNINCWVDIVKTMVDVFGSQYDYVLIPDARFPNEIDVWGDQALSVYIHRPNLVSALTSNQQQHASETSLNDFSFEYRVCNDGSIEKLDQDAEAIIYYLAAKNL